MSIPIPGVDEWRSFENYTRRYFSQLWSVELEERSVDVAGKVPWRFDLVSSDRQIVGDAKWLKNIAVPAAKWQAISEYIWLLQQVQAAKVFMVFGQDAEVAGRTSRRRGLLFYRLLQQAIATAPHPLATLTANAKQ